MVNIMNDGEEGPITLKLVSMDEKKDFLAMYMAHRMELISQGIEHDNSGRDDQLSKFWNEPDINYLIWIRRREINLGFAAISVINIDQARLLDMGILREHRGKGVGKQGLAEIARFSKYRGLKHLQIDLIKAPEGIFKFFISSGYKREGQNLSIDI